MIINQDNNNNNNLKRKFSADPQCWSYSHLLHHIVPLAGRYQ